MKTVHLYLLRHGKTWFNEKEIVQGWCDSLLTPDSIAQAEKLQPLLQQLAIDQVYCSPMIRTRQTAHCVLPGKEPIQDERLMEIHYGYLEGESAKTLQLFYPDRYQFDAFQGFAGGENWQTAGKRFWSCISEIVHQANHEEHVLIVSHGAIMTWFMHQLDPQITTKIPNLALAHIVYQDGSYRLDQILR